MTSHPRACRGGRLAAGVLALVAFTGCGSSTEPSYPPITGTYGGQGAPGAPFNAPAQFDVTYRAPDGTETRVNVQGTFIIAGQEGSDWWGEVRRHGFATGRAAGEVTMDGAITFTLSQPRWGDCTTADVVSHSGYSRSGGLSVTGRGTVSCDDGTELEVEEGFHGRLPEPPTSPG